MRAILLGLLAVSAVAIATSAFAQVTVDTPVGGVRVGPTAATTVTIIRGIAVTLATAALSPSAATTDLSVAFGAATK
jgi:hypothetical protein